MLRTMENKGRRGGFTIVEMMVATAILVLLLAVLLSALNSSTTLWTRGSSKIQSFQQARAAYEAMTRKISQATLNIYWDYERNASGTPIGYMRQSELQFVSGPATNLFTLASSNRTHAVFFQAPLGYATNQPLLQTLLNCAGYYLEFNTDKDTVNLSFLYPRVTERYRYRLMEMWQPSERLGIYSSNRPTNTLPPPSPWYSQTNAAMLAENIIALVIRPRLPEREDPSGNAIVTTGFIYNSKATNSYSATNAAGIVTSGTTLNQLPPVVQVTMVAIDERSANRQANGATMPTYGVTNWSSLFTDPSQFSTDLRTLENALISRGINYQVFDSLVPIQGAKWSR